MKGNRYELTWEPAKGVCKIPAPAVHVMTGSHSPWTLQSCGCDFPPRAGTMLA